MYEKSKYVVGEINGIMAAVIIPEVLQHSDLFQVFDQDTILQDFDPSHEHKMSYLTYVLHTCCDSIDYAAKQTD